QAGGKCRRKQRIGLDDAGIAVRRAAARFAAVDKRNREAPFDEVQRRRHADDTGAEYDCVGAGHRMSFARQTRHLLIPSIGEAAGLTLSARATLRGSKISFPSSTHLPSPLYGETKR